MTPTSIFEGIAAVSQLGMMFAVASGVWVAYNQLHAWREQDLVTKRSRLAEDLLATTLEISDILRGLRTPFDSIPESERDNRSYVYQKRLERFNAFSDKFDELRRLSIRAHAVLGVDEVDRAVEVLFDVRHRTIVAVQMLHDRPNVSGEEDEDTPKLYQQLRTDMYGVYSEKHDPLGMEQLRAIETLKTELTPIIRYQKL